MNWPRGGLQRVGRHRACILREMSVSFGHRMNGAQTLNTILKNQHKRLVEGLLEFLRLRRRSESG